MERFVSRRAFHFWTSKVAEEAEMGARDMGSTPAVAGPRPREVRLGVLQAGRSGERGPARDATLLRTPSLRRGNASMGIVHRAVGRGDAS